MRAAHWHTICRYSLHHSTILVLPLVARSEVMYYVLPIILLSVSATLDAIFIF